MQLLDSAQYMLQVFDSDMTMDVTVKFPAADVPAGYGAITDDRQTIRVPSSGATPALLIAHELGHTLMMQKLGLDQPNVNYGMNGGGWCPVEEEYESAAVFEGWAEYVSAVSWWDPNNSSAAPYLYSNTDLEDEVPSDWGTCSDNAALAFQVAKGFWDLDDANNEPATTDTHCTVSMDDDYNAGTSFIVSGWSVFADGTGNQQDNESDPDGRNLWDYYYNNESRFSNSTTALTTLLYHNLRDRPSPATVVLINTRWKMYRSNG